jgi:hypothetical protein
MEETSVGVELQQCNKMFTQSAMRKSKSGSHHHCAQPGHYDVDEVDPCCFFRAIDSCF